MISRDATIGAEDDPQRVAEAVRRTLGRGAALTPAELVGAIRAEGVWLAPGAAVPPRLLAAPAYHTLPDGRIVSVSAVVDGRELATAPRRGGLLGGADIALIRRRYPRWRRVPARGRGRRGMAELVPGRRARIVFPIELTPADPAALWVLTCGPEGIELAGREVDLRVQEAVDRLARRYARSSVLAGSVADAQLAFLAAEPALLRRGAGRLGRIRVVASRVPDADLRAA